MAVIRLQVLPVNTLNRKLNVPFPYLRSTQNFVEKGQIQNLLVNKQMQHYEEKCIFSLKCYMYKSFKPYLEKTIKL